MTFCEIRLGGQSIMPSVANMNCNGWEMCDIIELWACLIRPSGTNRCNIDLSKSKKSSKNIFL